MNLTLPEQTWASVTPDQCVAMCRNVILSGYTPYIAGIAGCLIYILNSEMIHTFMSRYKWYPDREKTLTFVVFLAMIYLIALAFKLRTLTGGITYG